VKHISLLIKPASSNCNMRCSYCFYFGDVEKRAVQSYGMMSRDTIETIVRTFLDRAEESCFFGFQGGEPMLAGLAFFQYVVELQQKYNHKGITITNALQTNGTLLDDTWAAFLAENKFLVGVSLDGYAGMQNLYRRDAKGNPTYDRVMRGISALKRSGAAFNILSVVTTQTAKHIREIYRFFMAEELVYQQYIPCIEPYGEHPDKRRYSLSPQEYARFLRELFDLWYRDRIAGRFVYNRYFENLAGILSGYAPESCDMNGICSLQYIFEADGGVYPCDFFMFDECRLGNINTDSLEAIDSRREQIRFIKRSAALAKRCGSCRWLSVCRGGCYRYRYGEQGLYYYCETMQAVLPYIVPKLMTLIPPNETPDS